MSLYLVVGTTSVSNRPSVIIATGTTMSTGGNKDSVHVFYYFIWIYDCDVSLCFFPFLLSLSLSHSFPFCCDGCINKPQPV